MNERTKEGNNEWRKNWVLVMLIKIINIFLAGSPWAAWTSGSPGEYFVFSLQGVREERERARVRYDILTVYFLFYQVDLGALGALTQVKKKDLGKILPKYVELVM